MYLYILVFIYLYISLSHLCIISFMRFYHDLAIHVLSIFLSRMLLLIHIFIYVPIIHVHVLIPMLCRLLLISIVLIIYAFLSCMILLIHIFIYVPIIHVHVLIPMLCHLLLISIVLIIYAFLSCVPSMFPLIHLCTSIVYSYHLRIPVMSLSIYILSIFLSYSIYSFMYDNHMFTSYNLIFICAYHSCTLDYHIL